MRKLADAVLIHGDTAQTDTARKMAESARGRVDESTNLRDLEERIVAADRACRELEAPLLRGKNCGSDVKISDTSEKNFRPIDPTLDLRTDYQSGSSPDGDNTTRKPAGFARREARPGRLAGRKEMRPPREPVSDFDGPAYAPPEATGAHRIRPMLAVKAASPRFLVHIPLEPRRPTPDDVIEAAKGLLPDLRISRAAWRYACQIVGPYPAALCVLVTDRATKERSVVSPGGYFRSMASRALSGTLAVDRSIFGFPRREEAY